MHATNHCQHHPQNLRPQPPPSRPRYIHFLQCTQSQVQLTSTHLPNNTTKFLPTWRRHTRCRGLAPRPLPEVLWWSAGTFRSVQTTSCTSTCRRPQHNLSKRHCRRFPTTNTNVTCLDSCDSCFAYRLDNVVFRPPHVHPNPILHLAANPTTPYSSHDTHQLSTTIFFVHLHTQNNMHRFNTNLTGCHTYLRYTCPPQTPKPDVSSIGQISISS